VHDGEGMCENARSMHAFRADGHRFRQALLSPLRDLPPPCMHVYFLLQIARRIKMQCLQAHGVLLSTEGPYGNIIKIKPPICFSIPDVDRMVGAMAAVLEELGSPSSKDMKELVAASTREVEEVKSRASMRAVNGRRGGSSYSERVEGGKAGAALSAPGSSAAEQRRGLSYVLLGAAIMMSTIAMYRWRQH
jgi:hypothetical protein